MGDETPPAFPTHFDPGQPLPSPAPPSPDKPGLAYLEQVHAQLAESWHGFLENCRLRLPPEHPLNDISLAVTVHLSLDDRGALQGVELEASSGQAEFDEAALELVREAAPYPTPSPEHLSDDDHVHLEWLLARDRRQAGVATANLRRVHWPATRAVPKFVSDGDIPTAARRLREALQSEPDMADAQALELGQEIAVAAIREALRSGDAVARAVAARIVAEQRLTPAADGLRAILDTSKDVSVRAQAVEAMGTVGDRGSVQLLVSILGTAKGSGAGGKRDVSIAAAKALSALDRADVAQSTILEWLGASDEESLWAALVVLEEFPVPAAVPPLLSLVEDSSKSREMRMTACKALGANATRATGDQVIKTLRSHFDDPDAALRAACILGVARAARSGVKSRFTYWQLIERIKDDRDEGVRAAAVRAAAALEPGLFNQAIYVLRKEKSVPVLEALARALGPLPDSVATKKLASLLEHPSPLVRRAAAASLPERDDAQSRAFLTGLIDDQDPYVRVNAIRAIDDDARLVALLDDESSDVRQGAVHALMRRRGRRAGLPLMLEVLATRPQASAEHARYAGAWLAAE